MTKFAWIRDRALTLTLMAMFLLFLVGHVFTGRAEYNLPHVSAILVRIIPDLAERVSGVASMVWLAVYLRQRWSPESKPVHAPHAETGH
jgi:hypothetical protein